MSTSLVMSSRGTTSFPPPPTTIGLGGISLADQRRRPVRGEVLRRLIECPGRPGGLRQATVAGHGGRRAWRVAARGRAGRARRGAHRAGRAVARGRVGLAGAVFTAPAGGETGGSSSGPSVSAGPMRAVVARGGRCGPTPPCGAAGAAPPWILASSAHSTTTCWSANASVAATRTSAASSFFFVVMVVLVLRVVPPIRRGHTGGDWEIQSPGQCLMFSPAAPAPAAAYVRC